MRKMVALKIILLFLVIFSQPAFSQSIQEPSTEMPALFIAHRIYVQPVTTAGDTLRLYTDTGGGLILLESTAKHLGLTIDTITVRGQSAAVTALPKFRANAFIPPVSGGRLLVLPTNQQVKLLNLSDGLLGQSWFGSRIWTFNYFEDKLILHKSAKELSFNPDHTVQLGFKTDSAGQRVNNFPSIEASIGGETYTFLFDTGATMILTDSAYAALDDGLPKVRGGSFIVQSIFKKWHTQNPNWRVIMNGGVFPGADLIKVPEITIAGHSVGPVWFATRSDSNFHDHMSSMMDRQVVGALGGSLFQYFIITVDYPRSRAVFQRP